MKILTFDIEDWWVYDYNGIGNKTDWLPRLDGYLNQILDLLDERNIKATFFILGEVAKNYPIVVRRIAERGHHIGCHSFSHKFLKNITPDEFLEDTLKALDAIENCIGYKVNAYRAPAFSITEHNKWALSILAENGIEYDCSIFPVMRSFGGFPTYKERVPSIIEIGGYRIKEFPISPANVLGRDVVYSGGGYFRLFPYWKIKSLVDSNEYVMTYFHVKDFDKKQKRIYTSLEGESTFIRYIKRYYGLSRSFANFNRLIVDFDFMNLLQADRRINWSNQPLVKL